MPFSFPVFDAHCDTLDVLRDNDSLYDCPYHFNLKKAGLYKGFTQVMAVWVDKGTHDVKKRTNGLIDRFYGEIERFPNVTQIKFRGDVLGGGIRVMLGIEGGEALCGQMDYLYRYYERGVRIITLTWNTKNEISGTCVTGGGLTPFGRKLIPEMERLGIMVDLSHISDEGFYDVCEIAKKPFVVSHSNSRAVCPHPRNLTDDQFRLLKKAGGVVGINLYPLFLGEKPDIDTIFAHIEHFMSLDGENHLGLGADLDGVDSLPEGFSGAEHTGQIIEYLLKKNYSESVVEKIACKNFENVFLQVL